MNIFNTLERLQEATIYELIQWKETGQEIGMNNQKIKGFSTQFEGFVVTTLVNTKEKTGFWGTKIDAGFAIKIEIGKKENTFTSDSEIISGKQNRDILPAVIKLSQIIQQGEPIILLDNKLQKMLHEK